MNIEVCPHSKVGENFDPALAFCPLQPLPQNVPFQEAFHLHTLFVLLEFLSQLILL